MVCSIPIQKEFDRCPICGRKPKVKYSGHTEMYGTAVCNGRFYERHRKIGASFKTVNPSMLRKGLIYAWHRACVHEDCACLPMS